MQLRLNGTYDHNIRVKPNERNLDTVDGESSRHWDD